MRAAECTVEGGWRLNGTCKCLLDLLLKSNLISAENKYDCVLPWVRVCLVAAAGLKTVRGYVSFLITLHESWWFHSLRWALTAVLSAASSLYGSCWISKLRHTFELYVSVCMQFSGCAHIHATSFHSGLQYHAIMFTIIWIKLDITIIYHDIKLIIGKQMVLLHVNTWN